MDINSVGGAALSQEAQMTYGIACIKMAQHSENAAKYLILDTAEISDEAMKKFLAERSEQ